MSSSGYTPWAVTAGEIPTTAYWNLLGSNDASFNTGNGFNDGVLQTRHFANNVVESVALAFSNALDSVNGVQSYTPSITSSSGGTWSAQIGYYINLGGMKLSWGTIGFSSSGSTNGHCILTQPSGFFSAIQIGIPAIQSEGNFAFQTASGDTFNATQVPFYVNNTGTGGACTVCWFEIGT